MTRLQRLMQMHRLQEKETGGEGGSGAGNGTPKADDGGEGGEKKGEGNGTPKTGDGEGGEGGETKKNTPTDAEAKLLKEVMQRKNEAKQAKDELDALKKQFDGIDPDAVRQLLADQKAKEQKELEARGEWDKLKAQMAEAHGAEKTTLQGQITEKEAENSSLRAQIAELTVGAAFSQSSFIRDELTLTPAKTRVVYGQHFEFKDGKLVGYDKPASDASRAALVDASGEPLAFEDAIKKIIETDPESATLIRSKMKAGASSKTDPGARTPAPSKDAPRGQSAISAGLKGFLQS